MQEKNYTYILEYAETAQFFWTEPQFQAAKFQWES